MSCKWEKRVRFFTGLVLAAAILWTGLHVKWSPAGETAVLQGAVSASKAYRPQPIDFPQGDVAVNRAAEEELRRLQGVGASLAAAIIQEREQNGDFFFPEDLLAVKGIGRVKLAGMREQIRLD